VTDFTNQDLSGAQFEKVDLRGSRFYEVDLRGARLREIDLRGAKIRSAYLVDLEMSGMVENLQVNGVDVAPLVNAELDRRYPDRTKMRPTDPAGFREAWQILERLWAGTVERARGFSSEQLHERVEEEWSYIETLRHLVFATDAWVNRVILGDPAPWHPLDLPFDDMTPVEGIPWDREARPTLDEVLALRAERMATVRRVIDELDDAKLAEQTTAVEEPGYPASKSYVIASCLRCILNEEWEHRMYAERDLDALQATR
jgi:hypothetical protein